MERAQGWRMEIVKELSKMISDIQADNQNEHRMRQLNDDINKRMRLKRAWEHRIVELGGPNYLGVHPTSFVDAGVAPDMKGGAYRYYGAAKNLPGVREMLKNAVETDKRAHRSVEQIRRSINVSYYGYLDEDDGVLLQAEADAEERLQEEKVQEFEAREEESKRVREEQKAAGLAVEPVKRRKAKPSMDVGFISHVTLPSQEEIEALIVQRKKMELLKQYASPELQEQLENTKANVKEGK